MSYVYLFSGYLKSEIIKQLLSKNPSERPSAFSILNSELFLTKEQIIANLYALLKQKEEHISLLQQQLNLKDELIEKKDNLIRQIFKESLA
jgi:hypothetical protein